MTDDENASPVTGGGPYLKHLRNRARENSITPFQYALIYAVEALDKTKADLAHDYEVAMSTVDRWLAGKSTPHPLVQKQIVVEVFEASVGKLEGK